MGTHRSFCKEGHANPNHKNPPKRKKGSQYREKSLHIEKRSPYGEKKASHIEGPAPPPLLDIPTGILKYAVYVLFICVWGGGGGS